MKSQTFWYYKDKKLIGVIESETLTQADIIFQKQSGQDPKKNNIFVTLQPVKDYDNGFIPKSQCNHST